MWEGPESASKVFNECGRVTKRSKDDRNKEREVGTDDKNLKRGTFTG